MAIKKRIASRFDSKRVLQLLRPTFAFYGSVEGVHATPEGPIPSLFLPFPLFFPLLPVAVRWQKLTGGPHLAAGRAQKSQRKQSQPVPVDEGPSQCRWRAHAETERKRARAVGGSQSSTGSADRRDRRHCFLFQAASIYCAPEEQFRNDR